MGWEYLHWIDLTLPKLMEVVIFKSIFPKFIFFANFDVFGTNRNVQEYTERSNGPETYFLANQWVGNLKISKPEGGECPRKWAGPCPTFFLIALG